MRYLITVVHDGPHPAPENVPAALYQAMGELVGNLQSDGVFVDAAGLAPPEAAKRVVLDDGAIEIVEGPFTETREWLGGYFLVRVDSEAEAVEIARQSVELHRVHFPGFDITHEVRQILEE